MKVCVVDASSSSVSSDDPIRLGKQANARRTLVVKNEVGRKNIGAQIKRVMGSFEETFETNNSDRGGT